MVRLGSPPGPTGCASVPTCCLDRPVCFGENAREATVRPPGTEVYSLPVLHAAGVATHAEALADIGAEETTGRSTVGLARASAEFPWCLPSKPSVWDGRVRNPQYR